MNGTRIEGSIAISFDTDRIVNEEQFKNFKKKLDKKIEDLEEMIYDLAIECGFEAESPYPITLEELLLEDDEY
jgi:hypothetical protein